MMALPAQEWIPLLGVVLLSLIGVVLSHIRLTGGREVYARVAAPLVTLSVCLEGVVLMSRALALQAVPLTGLFESMLVMTVVFSLVFLFLSIGIQQAWFAAVMSWLILILVGLTVLVAAPVSTPKAVAATPWAIAHGIAMVCGTAALALAAACAWLSLLARRRLKRKMISQVLGRIPTLEWLKRANKLGLVISLVLLTLGILSGLGMALVERATLDVQLSQWLRDPKVFLMGTTWLMLVIHLLLWRVGNLGDRAMARVTLVVFALALMATVGVTLCWPTTHAFS